MEKLLFTIPLVKYLFKNSQQFRSSELKKSCAKRKVLFILLFFLIQQEALFTSWAAFSALISFPVSISNDLCPSHIPRFGWHCAEHILSFLLASFRDTRKSTASKHWWPPIAFESTTPSRAILLSPLKKIKVIYYIEDTSVYQTERPMWEKVARVDWFLTGLPAPSCVEQGQSRPPVSKRNTME